MPFCSHFDRFRRESAQLVVVVVQLVLCLFDSPNREKWNPPSFIHEISLFCRQ